MKLLFFFCFLTINILTQNRWIKLNGPEGGSVSTIWASGDTVIAGVGNFKARFYYSINKGSKWERANFINTESVTSILRTDDNAILASVYRSGIYKSNNLKDWTFRVSFNNTDMGKDNEGNVYSGTIYGELYRSSNNGINWGLHFKVPEIILRFNRTLNDDVYFGTHGSVYRKKRNNLPTQWEKVLQVDNNDFRPFSDDQGNVFAHSGFAIYMSRDSGQTWTNQHTGNFFYANKMYECLYNHRLIGAFGDYTLVFGDGWGAGVSDDQGVTWRWAQTGLPPFTPGTRIAKSGTDTYLGTGGVGVYKSTDYGDSWFPINNGLNAAEVLDLHIDNEGTFYTASWTAGLAKSTDKGETWININKGITNYKTYSVIECPNGDLLAGAEGDVYRSTNKGDFWYKIQGPGNNFPFSLRRDKYDRIYAFNPNDGIFRSADNGNTWTKIDKNFESRFVFGFAIDNSDNIYAGTRGGIIYKSTDDGFSWIELRRSSNILSSVGGMAVAPNGHIFAASSREGVLKSTDEGNSWVVVKAEPNGMNYYPIAINEAGEICVSSNKEITYFSSDDGVTWENITSNGIKLQIRDIIFHEKDIYLATDEGIWRTNPDSLTSVTREYENVPTDYSLLQNYPNPFNASSVIKYLVPKEGYISIVVYDALGKEVTTLVNEIKTAGEYSCSFNADHLSSGIYFYQLKAENFISTRKMLLLK